MIVAFTDMQGRLMGKRFHAEFFVEEVDGCNYGLALDMRSTRSLGTRLRAGSAVGGGGPVTTSVA